MTAEHMPGDVHNVWRCPHADCVAVQQREARPTGCANGERCEIHGVGPQVADRRQRAREALYDARSAIRELPAEHDPVEIAIETATRVRPTGDVLDAAMRAYDNEDRHSVALGAAIDAAFRAAGFEVCP